MKVQGGHVLRKNNWRRDRGDYMTRTQAEIRLDRRSPGVGYRHLLTVADVRRFLDLLPDWDELAVGLDAIVLDEGTVTTMGWHQYAVVAVCAWERDLWWNDIPPRWIDEHDGLLERLSVQRVPVGGGLQLRWTEEQARAFQLLVVLTHELGHHHDRMTTRTHRRVGRGEPYAERYARRVADEVWPMYEAEFGALL